MDFRLGSACYVANPAAPLTFQIFFYVSHGQHSETFTNNGRIGNTTTLRLTLDGAQTVSGEFNGITPNASDALGNGLQLSASSVRVVGSGTRADGYTLRLSGRVSYCTTFGPLPGFPINVCGPSIDCDASDHIATLRPTSF